MTKIRLLSLLFFCLIPVAASAQDVLTLERACELARQNSPQIAAQNYAVEAAEEQLSEATFYWTPKLNLKSQFGPMPKTHNIEDSVDNVWDKVGDDWGFTMRNSLEFWMPLFTSTKVYHTRELAKIGLKVEHLRAENEILNVEYDVSRAFIGLQLANAAQDVMKEAEGYVTRIQNEYSALLEKEDPNVKETDQYRIDIAAANLMRLKNELSAKRDYAERALSVHTQLELPITVVEMDFERETHSLKSYDDILSIAHANRGDLRLLEQAEAASFLEAKIQWLDWWPDLVLAGEAYYKFSNAVPKIESKNFYISDSYNGKGFSLGFILRWDLDPVRQVFKVRQADAKAERMRAQRELAIAGIDLEVSEQYQKTANALANIEITYNSRRSSKRFLTNELMAYEAGDGHVNEMISALTTYIEQRSMYLQALHDYRVALVKLQKTVGASSVTELVD